MAKIDLNIHNARDIRITANTYYQPTGQSPQGFRVLKLSLRSDDGAELEISLFSDGKGQIPLFDLAGNGRNCAKCGDSLRRHVPDGVTVCSACETEGAAVQGTGG